MRTTQSRFFGVALNGVMFVPGTAECWGKREGDGVKGGLGHTPSLESHPGREASEIWMIVSGEKKQLSTGLLDWDWMIILRMCNLAVCTIIMEGQRD